MSEDVFRNTLVTLFTFVQKEFPEFDRQVKKCYINFNKSETHEYILFTKKSFKPYLKDIYKSDITIFEKNEKVKFIRGLNFSEIWAQYPQKFVIMWSQLQRVYISIYNYCNDHNIKLDNEENKYGEKFIEIVKLDYIIKDELKNMDNPNKAGELKEMMDKLKEIFEDSNSILTKTLKEIIGDIVPHNLSNPEEFIQSLMNGDKITEITSRLTEAIKKKFESGQLKEEDIKYDLDRIKNIFENSASNNNFVKNVMTNIKKEN